MQVWGNYRKEEKEGGKYTKEQGKIIPEALNNPIHRGKLMKAYSRLEAERRKLALPKEIKPVSTEPKADYKQAKLFPGKEVTIFEDKRVKA